MAGKLDELEALLAAANAAWKASSDLASLYPPDHYDDESDRLIEARIRAEEALQNAATSSLPALLAIARAAQKTNYLWRETSDQYGLGEWFDAMVDEQRKADPDGETAEEAQDIWDDWIEAEQAQREAVRALESDS